MRISQRLNAAIQTDQNAPRQSTFHHIDIRMASNPTEYANAFRIGYQVYYSQGYASHSPSGMRAMPYHFRANTVIFLAYHKGHAVASLSMFEDGHQGLPSDCGWKDNLDVLRKKRNKVFEIGSLMVLPDCPLRGPGICLALFRHAWMYARSIRGGDTLCAFVVARHALFYKKMLSFTSFAPTRDYNWNNLVVPGISAISLDLDTAETVYKKRFDRFGDSPKNLYHQFVVHKRAETEQQLRRESKFRKTLDMGALERYFQAIENAHAQKKTSNKKVLVGGQL